MKLACSVANLNDKRRGFAIFAFSWCLRKKPSYTEFVRIENYLFHRAKSSPALKLEFGAGDSDDGLMFHISIPYIICTFITISGVFGKLFRYPRESRQFGISYFDGDINIYPFSKINSWSSTDSWIFNRHNIPMKDIILGRVKSEEEERMGWTDIVVPMPEKVYKGKCRLYTLVHKRRFYCKRYNRGEIELEEGIAFPGKGENSWDCGEDATYSISCLAENVEDVISAMVCSALNYRRRYGGGLDYVPIKEYKVNKNHEKDVDNFGDSCKLDINK